MAFLRRRMKGDNSNLMTGAMNAAIAGLKSHMNKLNVIGNNIANVNTFGYKPGRVVFKDSLYTTMTSGSNGNPTTGGINPSQIGYGVQIGSIDLDMASGDYSPTGRALDTYIKGDGFFLVGGKDTANIISPDDPESMKSLTLTRVGAFRIDSDGYVVDNYGNCVYGFRCIGYKTKDDGSKEAVFSDQLVPLRLPGYGVKDPAAQDKEYEVKWPTDGRFDDQGVFHPDEEANRLEEAVDGNDNTYDRVVLDGISIDPGTGAITGTVKDSDQTITVGYIGLGIVDNPNGVTHQSGPYYSAEGGAGGLNVTTIGGIGESLGITHINGSLAGGQAYPNLKPDDLPDSMRVGSSGTTSLITGGLEMSKTDLSTEITEMITTQRGYQANTRIVTVTDSMLEELVNMKR